MFLQVNDLYRDARANALPGPELERIKDTFEADIRTQLSLKVLPTLLVT